MALVLNDRVRETTSVVGTGAVTLLGAVTGFQSFSTIGNSNTTYYCISDQAGVNWEVGIGTYTSAGTTLARTTVLASSNAGSLVSFTAGTKDVFVTYPSEKGVWYDASGNVLFTGTTTAANLAYTGTLTGSTGILNIGSGQVYKDASGNVGIGTTAPNNKLTIGTSNTTVGAACVASFSGANVIASNTSGMVVITPTEAMAADIGGSIGFAANSSSLNGYPTGSIAGRRENATAGNYSSYMQFTTCNSGGSVQEKMRIDSSGNVGIGTSSPTVKFQVGTYLNYGAAGTALISGANVAVTNTAGMFTVASTDSIAADIGGSIGFTANGTVAGYPTGSIAGRRENATASNYASYMQFSTCNSVGTVVEKMRIDSSGNVGIGTSSPSQKLHVAGSQLLSSPGSSVYTYFDGTLNSIGRKSTGELAITVAGGYPITFVNSTTEAMRIDSSGNVGIGTSSPAKKLDVVGDAQISFNSINTYLYYQSTNNYTGRNTDGNMWMNVVGGYSNIFGVGGVEKMRIDSSGNVGIGTTAPNASAILDAQSTTKGVRFPNMTTTQKTAVATPAAGLVVFDTTLAKLCVYSGVAWQTITSV